MIYYVGSNIQIQLGLIDWYDVDGNPLKVKIDITTNGGTSFTNITNIADNDSTYNYNIPFVNSNNCFFRYSDPDDSTIYFDSDIFSIKIPKQIIVLSSFNNIINNNKQITIKFK